MVRVRWGRMLTHTVVSAATVGAVTVGDSDGRPLLRTDEQDFLTKQYESCSALQSVPGAAKNWLTALGSIVVAGFSALCARTSPQARLGSIRAGHISRGISRGARAYSCR